MGGQTQAEAEIAPLLARPANGDAREFVLAREHSGLFGFDLGISCLELGVFYFIFCVTFEFCGPRRRTSERAAHSAWDNFVVFLNGIFKDFRRIFYAADFGPGLAPLFGVKGDRRPRRDGLQADVKRSGMRTSRGPACGRREVLHEELQKVGMRDVETFRMRPSWM